VSKEEEKVIVDPLSLQKNARLDMLRKLRKDIEVDKMICQFEGWTINDFLDDLKAVVNSYYELEDVAQHIC
jgi:hypothetical protein